MITYRYQRYHNKGGDKVYQMILRFPTELREQLKSEADKRGQTLTGLIKQILWEWVKENGLDEK